MATVAQFREGAIDPVEIAVQLAPNHLARVSPHQQIVFDAHGAEQPPAFRHMHDPPGENLRRIVPRDILVVGEISAALGRNQSGQRAHQGGLAGAVRADQRGDLATPHRHVDAP